MQFDLRRREFITLLGGAAMLPLEARAQQRPLPVVGFLHYASPKTLWHLGEAVRQGLEESGFTDGHNVIIDYRWADGRYDRLPVLAEELVRRKVDVIVAGGNNAAQAARKATTTIPVVFTSGADPVKSGLVASIHRPGGNLTGASLVAAEIAVKRLEVTRDLIPNARSVTMIINPTFAGAEAEMDEVEMAGRILGMQTHRLAASNPADIDTAFATIGERRVDAFMVGTDGFFIDRREQIAALAARYKVGGMYPYPDYPRAGGLVSYGPDLKQAYNQAGIYAGRILKGAKPADLPIVQPTKFELVINLKTAKALGIAVSPTMLARADEVIE
jgi:putative ABC transport system substrate-binding protein